MTLSALTLASGCAFSEGSGWGVAEVSLEVYMAPGADRLTSDGHLVTSSSYAVRIDALELTLEAVTLRIAGQAVGAFDPAAPPPGYSLCHNGHCHAEDGSLPTYAQISATLMSSGAVAGITLAGPADPVNVDEAPTPVDLGPCPDACEMDPGELSAVELRVPRLRIVGHVFDQLTGDEARLPAEGLALDVDLPLALSLSTPVAVAFGQGEPLGARLDAVFSVPSTLLDGVDFASAEAITPQALTERLSENVFASPGSFSIAIERFQ